MDKKKFVSGILAASLLLAPTSAVAEKIEFAENAADLVGTGLPAVTDEATYRLVDNLMVFYNNVKMKLNQPAAIDNGRTLLPMRDFFNGIGYDVGWNEQTKVATVYKEKLVITIRTESGDVYVNDKAVTLDVPPQLINNRIYVPLRFLSETLGCQVDYSFEGNNHLIQIKGNEPETTMLANGTITKIKNRTITLAEPEDAKSNSNFLNWYHNHTDYFQDNDGYLYQVNTVADYLELNKIDTDKAKVISERYQLSFKYPAITDIRKNSRDSVDVVLQRANTSDRYIGVGSATSDYELGKFDTAFGRMYLYSGRNDEAVVNISTTDGKINGVFYNDQYGYVLDTAECSFDIDESDYAIADNGNYGFLVDNYIMIIDPNKGEMLLEEKISDHFTQGSIDFINGEFVVSGIEESILSLREGFYTAVYSKDGVQQHYYSDKTPKLKNHKAMNILDRYTADGSLYVLLETYYDNYLVKYDVEEDFASVTELPYQYDQFIPSGDGMKLFMKAPDAFYLQKIQ